MLNKTRNFLVNEERERFPIDIFKWYSLIPNEERKLDSWFNFVISISKQNAENKQK